MRCYWVKQLLSKSSDQALVKRIDGKFEDIDELEQGGITYVKIALDEIFYITNDIDTSLHGFLKSSALFIVVSPPNFSWDPHTDSPPGYVWRTT